MITKLLEADADKVMTDKAFEAVRLIRTGVLKRHLLGEGQRDFQAAHAQLRDTWLGYPGTVIIETLGLALLLMGLWWDGSGTSIALVAKIAAFFIFAELAGILYHMHRLVFVVVKGEYGLGNIKKVLVTINSPESGTRPATIWQYISWSLFPVGTLAVFFGTREVSNTLAVSASEALGLSGAWEGVVAAAFVFAFLLFYHFVVHNVFIARVLVRASGRTIIKEDVQATGWLGFLEVAFIEEDSRGATQSSWWMPLGSLRHSRWLSAQATGQPLSSPAPLRGRYPNRLLLDRGATPAAAGKHHPRGWRILRRPRGLPAA